ncbi:putative E3 ubiquitin-protein ligase [Colletotrichum chlorophyti]|uniref:RBR-type E3 ubiquitin transferase n=1 Tax=Colletotrichum chlorophyti TaxID=708187 RepID=A0A1Q8S882_9PEZI|nr:putative E3 ubiquitin-protein ligase [Colletotrichum chlorophyti]
MAYQDGAELHRRMTRRWHPPSPPPAVADYDWRPGGETTFDSLPYRRPRDFIQGPDKTTSSPGRSRSLNITSGAPTTVRPTMPRASNGAPYVRGRVPVGYGYGYDEYDGELPERGRSPRSAQHSRSRRLNESRQSSRSSRSGSDAETDEESDTSLSSSETARVRRRAKDRHVKVKHGAKHEKAARHTVVERHRPANDKKPKRVIVKKYVYMEEEDGSTEPTARQSLDERSGSPARYRSHRSRPASEKHHSRQRSHTPVRRASHHHPSPTIYEISKPPNSSKRCAHGSSLSQGVNDPQEMPPKCCSQTIALRHVDSLFSDDFKKKWNKKFAEYSVRNRVYCPSRDCGAWIKPHNIHRSESGRKYGKCSRCRLKVCCACNGKWHSSRECPRDDETARFMEQAKEEGWKRCYKCNHMVELKEGCNHMTCRCGAQFCMGCDCPWFSFATPDEDYLDDMRVPDALQRRGRLDLDLTSRSMRPAVGPLRSRSQDYDDRLMRRFRENREEDTQQGLSYADEVYEGGYGEIVGIGNTAGHLMTDDHVREVREPDVFVSPPVPPAPTPPAVFERPTPTDYMSGVNRARGLPQDPLGQRLAERFSEFRSGSGGPRPGMVVMPPPPPPMAPMSAPMGPLPMIVPMMGAPTPRPMLRRHTMEDEMYHGASTTRPSERMVPGRVVHDYDREAAVHAPRSRRRMREEPKSSTLAGLTGMGRGMNRVFEWRNHVRPGMPEGESAVA